jgi:hypothetical protein
MKWKSLCVLSTLPLLVIAPAAWAASDYLLEIDGVAGEATTSVEVLSWSWRATNPGAVTAQNRVVSPRDSATGQASGRLRESPSRPSTGSTRVAAADVNGDGRADIVVASTVDEVQRFTLVLDGASPVVRQYCATGRHIPQATITASSLSVYELKNVMVSSCTTVPGPRQTQGATFGERCVASQCPSPGPVAMTLTGQMKYTKTGHVTLMK